MYTLYMCRGVVVGVKSGTMIFLTWQGISLVCIYTYIHIHMSLLAIGLIRPTNLPFTSFEEKNYYGNSHHAYYRTKTNVVSH